MSNSHFQKSQGLKNWAKDMESILDQRYKLTQSTPEALHFSVGGLSHPKKSLSSTVDFIHEIQRQLSVKRRQLA